jgi:membrane fusion protein, peptide pheromone/bacteriocin exporter
MDLIPTESVQYTLESYFVKVTTSSRIIYWIIIGVILFMIVILPFIYVDVSVQARGFFQSDIEKQFINTPFDGRIIFSSIQTGKEVHKGDTLLIIDSETIRAQKEILEKRIGENDISMDDLRLLTILVPAAEQLQVAGLRSARYISEYASFSKQYLIQFQKLQKTETEHNRSKVLYGQKLIADAEYENSLYSLNAEKENLNRIMLSQKASWQTDLSQRRNDSVSFYGEYRKLNAELDNRIVVAPVDGEIIRSSEIQQGSFVLANQNVMEISPEGDLLASCFVKPSEIGLIYENQPVIIQVDAFNYNEWGMLKGSILDISDDMIVENNSSAFFRIKCRLDKKTLSLKNGYKAEMKKGMSLTARIIVARRSLFNLLFDKMDKWFNPYMNGKNSASSEDKS